MKLVMLVVATLVLVACQEKLSPRAEQLMQESRAELAGETWPKINADNFARLKMGSSYEDAVALIGPGEEMSRSEMTGQSVVIYEWLRPDGGNISLTFNNGILVSKAQAGLYHP